MIRKAKVRGDVHGVQGSKQTPLVSHLFFTDDNVLFARASIRDHNSLKRILHAYKGASAQKINFEKSTVIINRNL